MGRLVASLMVFAEIMQQKRQTKILIQAGLIRDFNFSFFKNCGGGKEATPYPHRHGHPLPSFLSPLAGDPRK
jgi:hypothetical protein